MVRSLTNHALLIACLTSAWLGFSTEPTQAEEGFDSLFNGRDLTGWDGDPRFWSVEDGAITGRTKGPDDLDYNRFLILKDQRFSNFVLRVRFRLEGDNNSGIQYRSLHLPNSGDHVVKGYQADINARPEYTGMLYDERGRGILAERGQQVFIAKNGKKNVTYEAPKGAALNLEEWHELEITAFGNRLTHRLDGNVIVDVIDGETAEAEAAGLIALQIHRGPAMKIQFKDIRIARFPDRPGQFQPSQSVPRQAAQNPARRNFGRKFQPQLPRGQNPSGLQLDPSPSPD